MRDNIWFTYKARIQAHLRLERNDFHSQLLLVWYAIASTCLAVVCLRYPKIVGDDTDLISTVLSVALMAVSLAVANRDFRGRAIFMRENYLALQRLYNSTSATAPVTQAQLDEYHVLLAAAENHSKNDDRRSRIEQAATLTSRMPTRRDYTIVVAYGLGRFFVLALFYLAPVVPVAMRL